MFLNLSNTGFVTLHPLHFLVAPVSVNIVNKVDRLVVGRESEIVCRSTGSRPPAHITWYLGGQRLEGGGTAESVSIIRRTDKPIQLPSFFLTPQASSDGNATVSILSLRPKMDHIGKSLVCKATNPLISGSDLFDNMDLSIDCKCPKSALTFIALDIVTFVQRSLHFVTYFPVGHSEISEALWSAGVR